MTYSKDYWTKSALELTFPPTHDRLKTFFSKLVCI